VNASLQFSGDAENAAPVAHTPGPWVWDHNRLRPAVPDPDSSSVHTVLERGGGYGYLNSNWRKTLRELDADYTLIAAAPELLAALQALVQHHAANDADGSLAASPHLAAALAAIAKATGAPA
jgi:hypothetical protein